MTALSLSVDLESGTFDVDNTPGPGVWLSSVTRAAKVWRRIRASSPFTHGSTQTHAVLEDAQIDVVLYAEAASAAALDALKDEVEAAFGQFVFTMAVTEDGVVKTYTCDCADITWNPHDEGMARRLIAQATLNIPVFPVAS